MLSLHGFHFELKATQEEYGRHLFYLQVGHVTISINMLLKFAVKILLNMVYLFFDTNIFRCLNK